VASAFPFHPRRKKLFDKLHDDFLAVIMLIGCIALAGIFIRYLTGW